MSKEKRKRSPNWLPSEKTLLLDLVDKYFTTIENKKTDGVSMKHKNAGWDKITKEYNCQTTHIVRSAEHLKSQWESMKKYAKKDELDQNGNNYKKEDSIHLKIISLIKRGLNNHLDSSSVTTERSEKNLFAEVILPEDSSLGNLETDIDDSRETDEVDSDEAIIKDWSNYTPKLVKTHVSAPLNSNNNEQKENLKKSQSSRQPTNETSLPSFQKLHEKKIESIDSQKTVAEKETLHLKEAHQLDLQIKRERLKQEKIKTRILLIDLRLKRQLLNKN